MSPEITIISGIDCPHGYGHLGPVDEPRRCSSVVDSKTTMNPNACEVLSQDMARKLSLPKEGTRLTAIRELLKYKDTKVQVYNLIFTVFQRKVWVDQLGAS